MKLYHTGSVLIFTERLILRKFNVNDDIQMFNNWASDEEVTKNLTWSAHKTIDETRKFIDIWIHNYNYVDNYNWAMQIKDTNELIGSIGLFYVDDFHHSCELGYCIGKKYWNKGYTTEASKAIIDYCFNRVGFNRITGCCFVGNVASRRVLEKCGMQFEGIERQKYNSPTGFRDCENYAVLRDDYISKAKVKKDLGV